MLDLDAPRSAASVLLLTRLAGEHGLPVQPLLDGTGIDADRLRVPGTEVTARQELAVLRAMQRARPGLHLALEAGRRYHLTTYGIWGFA
ncbi:MAG TPA: AraC family transcriptional regulator ligand-binding domain-containing protein, partial [Mycobacteriales bacterium]|nr:AraC family transcriptional regulator ligand-binding domain-containing protein [Mycobacteriales bacterium]